MSDLWQVVIHVGHSLSGCTPDCYLIVGERREIRRCDRLGESGRKCHQPALPDDHLCSWCRPYVAIMVSDRVVHCWFDFENGHTCMLLRGHVGDHEPTADSDIMVTLVSDDE